MPPPQDHISPFTARTPVETVFMPPMMFPYPPENEWACDSKDTQDIWTAALASRRKANNTFKKVTKTNLINYQRLERVVPPNESVIVRDENTNEVVFVVIRDFVLSPGILAWLQSLVVQGCQERKNVRVEDPGYGVLVGYTGGQWTNPSMGFGEPKVRMSDAEFQQRIEEYCSACAFICNEAFAALPGEIGKDFRAPSVPRMDFNDPAHPTHGKYHVRDGNKVHYMEGEFGTPAALFGLNYCRYSHREVNGNTYVMSLTTQRTRPSVPEEGGHFFVSSYGILALSTANSLTVWRSTDIHGTTVQNTTPLWGLNLGAPFLQGGWAMLIQKRILKLTEQGNFRDQPEGKHWQIGQKRARESREEQREGLGDKKTRRRSKNQEVKPQEESSNTVDEDTATEMPLKQQRTHPVSKAGDTPATAIELDE